MSRYESKGRRTFDARRDAVWAIVADTNRMNRAAGNVPARYAWREVDGRREYVASARDMGQTIEWVEPPYQWIEGEFIESERRFVAGPARGAFFNVRLTRVEGGTGCELSMGFEGEGPLLAAVGWVVRLRHRAALRRALTAVGAALARGESLAGDASEPATVRARRMLTVGYDPVSSGPRAPVDAAALAVRLDRLAREGVDAGLRERLGAWLSERPDEEVAQMRPFELADVWGLDRRETLSLFLRATRAGLVDLRWQVNCPVCRVSAQVAEGLSEVGSRVHCGACDVSYGVDFGRYVEAVFQSSPALRRVVPAVFCAASPSWRPHVFAQLTLAAGGARTETAALPLGELHARMLRHPGGADLTLDHAPATLAIALSDEGVTMAAEGRSADGRTELHVTSSASAPRTLLVERSGWSAAQVSGAVVASFPDFLDLFATEAPATGVELTIGHLTVLFSDLTGSTALYERVGDARAFALVEEHFSLMASVIARHEGAVVKTMGDAVMATFPSTAHGVRAALEMVRAHDERQGPLGLGVKIGVHTGACLAVRANERLDFFGGTVNLAARLQAQAWTSEVVLTEETAREPSVRALIGALPERAFEARLKGIEALQRLVGVDARGPTAPAPGSGPPR